MADTSVTPEPPAELVAGITDPMVLAQVVLTWRQGWEAGRASKPRRHIAGPVEKALRRDLDDFGDGKVQPERSAEQRRMRAGRATLVEMACALARGVDDSTNPTTTAKMTQELRAVLALLRGDPDSDSGGEGSFGDRMSTPVGDTTIP